MNKQKNYMEKVQQIMKDPQKKVYIMMEGYIVKHIKMKKNNMI